MPYSLLADASSFVACTAALLLRDSAISSDQIPSKTNYRLVSRRRTGGGGGGVSFWAKIDGIWFGPRPSKFAMRLTSPNYHYLIYIEEAKKAQKSGVLLLRIKYVLCY